MTTAKKIECKICGAECHSIELHLKNYHPEMGVKEYQKRFPDAPILSELARAKLDKMLKERDEEAKSAGLPLFHEVFGFDRKTPGVLSTKGHKPIPIHVLEREENDLIPEVNTGYIYDPIELKYVVSGVENNFPVYIWGHKGAGKTELVEQICARTNRPLLRVQHTVNTEESQIVGQWTVREGETRFEYGPLPMAMIHGWAFLADEYDFAMPNVLAVYQAVLEGKPLMIKEAPPEMRIVKPHPNFRFFATGNTNGTGDESGLYQGTSIQNSANYDRFGVVVRKKYLATEDEIEILRKNTGVAVADAKDLVAFAKSVREAFDSGEISDTISPRTLLFAAKLGVMHASFGTGLRLAFLNKLSSTDREACVAFAQRHFGKDDYE